jgi:hypothetical protein
MIGVDDDDATIPAVDDQLHNLLLRSSAGSVSSTQHHTENTHSGDGTDFSSWADDPYLAPVEVLGLPACWGDSSSAVR